MQERLRFGSLFAGVGGFDLGFECAGLECAWQVENDLTATSVLAYHYPQVLRRGDIRDCGAHNLPWVDVIVGGFPCQDLSAAGLRKGFAGSRSALFFEMVRIVDELRPTYLCWENVVGLLSSNHGRDFAKVLMALDDIGYSGAWTMLDAQFFGVPQRRQRIFGVFAGGDSGAERGAEILSLAHRLRWRAETGQGPRQNITGSLTTRSGRSSGADEAGGGVLIADTLTAKYSVNGGIQAGNDSNRIRNAVLGVLPFDTTQVTSPGNYSNPQPGDPSHPLSSSGHAPAIAFESRYARNGRGAPSAVEPPLKAQSGGSGKGDGAPLICFSSKDNGRDAGDLAPTMRAMQHDRSRISGGGQLAIASPSMGIRRLTPIECERLQGFPDQWTRFGVGGKEISNSHRYRLLGNAVAVPVAEWLGSQLIKFTE